MTETVNVENGAEKNAGNGAEINARYGASATMPTHLTPYSYPPPPPPLSLTPFPPPTKSEGKSEGKASGKSSGLKAKSDKRSSIGNISATMTMTTKTTMQTISVPRTSLGVRARSMPAAVAGEGEEEEFYNNGIEYDARYGAQRKLSHL